jgi:hypothetical protein
MFLAEHIIMPFRNLCREEEDLVYWSSKFKSKIARLREKLPFSLRVPHSFTEVKGLEILHASITKAKAQLARLKPGQRRFPTSYGRPAIHHGDVDSLRQVRIPTPTHRRDPQWPG